MSIFKAYRIQGIARTILIVSTLTVQTRASRAITGSLWSAKRQAFEVIKRGGFAGLGLGCGIAVGGDSFAN